MKVCVATTAATAAEAIESVGFSAGGNVPGTLGSICFVVFGTSGDGKGAAGMTWAGIIFFTGTFAPLTFLEFE